MNNAQLLERSGAAFAGPDRPFDQQVAGFRRAERAIAKSRRVVACATLPRREGQVAGIVAACGTASAREIGDALPDLSLSATRSMLMRLELKGIVVRRHDGRRYVYSPARQKMPPREHALRMVADNLFGGSLVDTLFEIVDLLEASDPGSGHGLICETARQHRGRRQSISID